MLELAKLVEENAQLLAALATLETGVPLARTRSEVDLDHETGPWRKIYETILVQCMIVILVYPQVSDSNVMVLRGYFFRLNLQSLLFATLRTATRG